MKKLCVLLAISLSLLSFSSCRYCNVESPIVSYDFIHFDFEFFYVSDGKILKETINNDHRMDKIMETWLALNSLNEKFDQVHGEICASFDTEPPAKEGEYIFDYGSTRYFFTADFSEFINAPENSLYKEALEMTLDSADKLLDRVIEEEKQKYMQDS